MRRLFRYSRRTARDIDRDVDAELRFHLDARTESLIEGGLSAAEARAQAVREFGDVEDARRYMARVDGSVERERRRRDLMGELGQDVLYALRKLRSSPVFSITAIVTLALGIGANTAIFSVVSGVLFRPLAFPDSEQLFRVWSANRTADDLHVGVSSPDIEDWRAQRQRLSEIGGYWFADGGSGLDLTGSGEPQRLSVAFVTAGFFETLGVSAMQGRLPREDEMVRGGADHNVVLSHGFWQRNFGGSSVFGSAVTLNGLPYEVLGVMPPSFDYPSERVDVYVPYSSIPDASIPHIRPVRILTVVARARSGVTLDAAREEMNTITARLAQQYPENRSYDGATVEPLRDSITGSVRTGLLVVLGAVAFVLLLACVNVASLLLARSSSRGREIATRVALGAGRARIVRQMLTESVVLGLLGGIAGIAVARFALSGLLWLSANQLPRSADVRLDGTMLMFALLLSIVTGLLFGTVPALRAAPRNLQGTLREGGRSLIGGDGRRLRSGLVIAEVALSVVLVMAAGLMVRSFVTLMQVDPGFRPDHLLAVNFTINTASHPRGEYPRYYADVIERVRTLPGVVDAGAIKDAPFRGLGERWSYRVPGNPVAAGEDDPTAMILHVSDGYFRTIGARLADGREFTPLDRAETPFSVVVNEALARRQFPGVSAVGRTLDLDGTDVPIIGVVHDVHQTSLEEPAQPTIYVNNQQNSRIKVTLVVRTQGDPLTMVRPVREAIWSLDADQTITSIFTFDDIVGEALARPRLLTALLGGFGLLGLALGALGIYGLLAYVVNQQQREIGVRIALGAHPRSVLAMIVGRGLVLTFAGVAVGLAGSLGLVRYIRGVLYGIEPTDPLTFVIVTIVLFGVATLASWLPARRAAAVDPVVALRYE